MEPPRTYKLSHDALGLQKLKGARACLLLCGATRITHRRQRADAPYLQQISLDRSVYRLMLTVNTFSKQGFYLTNNILM
jgi:hypothetical protein